MSSKLSLFLANWRKKWECFKQWQKSLPQVAPIAEGEQVCATCGTHFQGNYCPRCGQRANIGRFSAKTALLNFFDVWGMGNRSIFRTVRDLLLRPGYMIRDYLSGRQRVYFPPFKMLFIFITISLFFSYQRRGGISLQEKLQNAEKHKSDPNPITEMMNQMLGYAYDHLSVVSLIALLIITPCLYRLFRRSPAIPRLRYSEMFITLVYFTVVLNIFSIVGDILILLLESISIDVKYPISSAVSVLFVGWAFIAMRQLFSYNLWQSIWRGLLAAFIILLLLIFALFALAIVAGIKIGAFDVE